MVLLTLIPVFVFWLVAYSLAKYPAQAFGPLVVRRSPNVFSDIGFSIILTFLSWGVVMAVVLIIHLSGQHYPYTMVEIATAMALALAPPVLVALFKGTQHARSASQAR